MGKRGGGLSVSGKVKNQTPKVEKKEHKKCITGRAKKRKEYNSLCHQSQKSQIPFQKINTEYPIRKGWNEVWEVPLHQSETTFVRNQNPPSGMIRSGRSRVHKRYKSESELELKFDRSHHPTKKNYKKSYIDSFDEKISHYDI